MKIWLMIIGVALAALHHDFWLWDDGDLLLGFLPVGLGYHAAYSTIVAIFWAAVVTWAWPKGLAEQQGPSTSQDES